MKQSGAVVLLLGLAAVAPPANAAWSIRKVAVEGDAASHGGTINQMFGRISVDASGRVAFATFVDNGVTTDHAVIRGDGSSLETLVVEGDLAADTGGATFAAVDRPVLGAAPSFGWLGLYFSPALGSGVFVRAAGGDSAAVLSGDALPAGGTVSQVGVLHERNAAGDMTWHADVDTGGPITAGLFRIRSGAIEEVARDGDAAPVAVGGTYTGIGTAFRPGLSADGSVVFWSEVAGGSRPHGLFRTSAAGATTVVLLQGDSVLTPKGGSYQFIGQLVSASPTGDVTFEANLLRAGEMFARPAVVVLSGATQREVIDEDGVLPGTGGEHFSGLAGSTPPSINSAGDVAFPATTYETSKRGVFVERAGAIELVAQVGDPVPGRTGETFTDFPEVEINESGDVGFFAFTNTGAGVFVARPVEPVPSASPGARLTCVATLLIAGAWLAARRAR